MRTTILAAVAALTVAVAGQGNLLNQIPKCAQDCFGNNLGSCGPLDIACICGNTAVINSVSCCVFATCSEADKQATITFATGLCKLQNVNVNTNPTCPANGGSSASAASSAAAAASGTASGAASRSPTASVTQVSGSASRSASAGAATATSAGAAAPLQTAGAGLMGVAMAGVLALL